MDLRSGISLWQDRHVGPVELPSSAGDATCEVAVLGGGITGALVALLLIESGVDVVLVDKRLPGQGSTTASTGLLQYEIDTPLSHLARQVGMDRALHAYRRGLTAVDELAALVERLDDRAGYSRRDTLCFCSRPWHILGLRREFELRKASGFDVRLLRRRELAEISSIRSAGALRSSGDAQIDPYRLTLAVLRRAVQLGLRIYSQAKADRVDEKLECVLVHTPRGLVSARVVVYATGYEAGPFLSERVARLHSTYALASRPMASSTGWPDGCLIWETARPYFYARQTDDGRAIIGGADTAFKSDHQRDALVERQSVRLIDQFRRLFPAIEFEPEFTWAGTFGETDDGLAYIGSPSGRPRAYFALGYGGNGITFAMIAARLIADLHLGRPNRDAAVFSFER